MDKFPELLGSTSYILTPYDLRLGLKMVSFLHVLQSTSRTFASVHFKITSIRLSVEEQPVRTIWSMGYCWNVVYIKYTYIKLRQWIKNVSRKYGAINQHLPLTFMSLKEILRLRHTKIWRRVAWWTGTHVWEKTAASSLSVENKYDSPTLTLR
jgi:hypothetical protein